MTAKNIRAIADAIAFRKSTRNALTNIVGSSKGHTVKAQPPANETDRSPIAPSQMLKGERILYNAIRDPLVAKDKTAFIAALGEAWQTVATTNVRKRSHGKGMRSLTEQEWVDAVAPAIAEIAEQYPPLLATEIWKRDVWTEGRARVIAVTENTALESTVAMVLALVIEEAINAQSVG